MALRQPNSFFTVALLATWTTVAGCSRAPTETTDHVKTKDLPVLPAAITPKKMPRSTEQIPKNLTLAVVGEVRGELEPCGCPTLPFGGFERRNTLLQNLKQDGPGPVFHVDAGDMLIKGFSTRRIDDPCAVHRLPSRVGIIVTRTIRKNDTFKIKPKEHI